jgi:hypothetical protein
MTHHRNAALVAGAALLAAAFVLPARADGLVVAEARGGTLHPGETIDAGRPIKLEPGQRVTLIAGNGAVIKLTGPFEGVPDPEGQRLGSVADSLLKLTSQTVQGTSTLGAVRAGETVPPEPWLVSVAGSGQRCVQEGKPLVLWHAPVAEEQPVEISPADHAWQASTSWPAGTDKLAMPADFPAQDGQAYVFTIGGTTATVTLHIIPPALSSDAMRAAWMIEKGCGTQARVLVAGLK